MTLQLTIISSDHTFFRPSFFFCVFNTFLKKIRQRHVMQYGLIVFHMHYVKKKDVEALFSTESKMCVHLFFVRTPPLFRPEMMFSYFTPKLQLLGKDLRQKN